jgi:hypothetical protein
MRPVRHFDLPAPAGPDDLSQRADELAGELRRGETAASALAEQLLGRPLGKGSEDELAQEVIAREHGFADWPSLLRAADEPPHYRVVSRLGTDLDLYRGRARSYLDELRGGSEPAARRFRGHVPRLAEVQDIEHLARTATTADAEVVVAREVGCLSWREMTEAVQRLRDRSQGGERWCQSTGVRGEIVARIRADDAARVRALLSDNPDLVALRDADNGTLLETVIQPDGLQFQVTDPSVVQAIADAGADLDRALNLAAGFNRVEFLDVLLRAGADVKNTVEWGITPLEAAILHGSAEATQRLASVEVVPPALWVAAGSNRVDLLDGYLDDARLRPEAYQSRPEPADIGWPIGPPPEDDDQSVLDEALVLACHVGATSAAVWLLDHGADINAKPAPGLTALHYAVSAGRKETVDMLLGRGADASITDDQHGSTALGWAEHHADAYPDSPHILRTLAGSAS